jgi:hypothetical protein
MLRARNRVLKGRVLAYKAVPTEILKPGFSLSLAYIPDSNRLLPQLNSKMSWEAPITMPAYRCSRAFLPAAAVRIEVLLVTAGQAQGGTAQGVLGFIH